MIIPAIVITPEIVSINIAHYIPVIVFGPVIVAVIIIITIVIEEVRLHLIIVRSLVLYVFVLFCHIRECRQARDRRIRGINAFHNTIRYVVVTMTAE